MRKADHACVITHTTSPLICGCTSNDRENQNVVREWVGVLLGSLLKETKLAAVLVVDVLTELLSCSVVIKCKAGVEGFADELICFCCHESCQLFSGMLGQYFYT